MCKLVQNGEVLYELATLAGPARPPLGPDSSPDFFRRVARLATRLSFDPAFL